MAGKKTNEESEKPRGPKLKLRHAAVLQSGRWMGRRANTRVPAFFMILGYPATLIIVLCSPFVMIGIGLLTCMVLWHVSYRSVVRANDHATKAKLSQATDWAARVTALVPAYLAWIMLVRWHTASLSLFGTLRNLFGTIFDGHWFIGYAAVSTVAWLAIFRAPHMVTKHVERKVAEANPFKSLSEFDGSKLLSEKPTRTGKKYKFNVMGTGKGQSDFLDKKTKERIGGIFGIGEKRVIVTPSAGHAGQIEVTVRSIDPWELDLVHPAAPDYPQGRNKITDPIVLGVEPESGTELKISLATSAGGQHVVVISGTRGGKTTLMNSVVERLTRPEPAKRDTDVIMIDVSKGKDGRAWAPAVAESHMGPEGVFGAVLALERMVALVQDRARTNRDAIWKVGTKPADRAKVIIIDEASELLAHPGVGVSDRAKAAVKFITGKGASEMVILIVMSQRGVLTHLGTGDIAANSFVKIMLGVARKGEMHYVVPDWEEQGMPDMSKYGDGRKGVALISQVGESWSSGRTWNLSNLVDIRKIAADRVIPDEGHLRILQTETEYARRHPNPINDDPEVKAMLAAEAEAAEVTDPEIFDLDPDPQGQGGPGPDPRGHGPVGSDDPDDPDNVAGAPWGDPRQVHPVTPERPRKLTEREERFAASFGRPSTPGGGWRPRVPDPVRAVRDLAEVTAGAVQMVSEALNVELARDPAESAQRFEVRRLATAKEDQSKVVPEGFVTSVLHMISDLGEVSRQQVVEESGLGKTVVAERLRIMVNQGVLEQGQAGGHATRYRIRVPDTLEG